VMLDRHHNDVIMTLCRPQSSSRNSSETLRR
jgi:hypothetical protein